MDSYEAMQSFYRGLEKAIKEQRKRQEILSGQAFLKGFQDEIKIRNDVLLGQSLHRAFIEAQDERNRLMHQFGTGINPSPTMKAIQQSIIMFNMLENKNDFQTLTNINIEQWTKRSTFMQGMVEEIARSKNMQAISENEFANRHSKNIIYLNSVIDIHNKYFSNKSIDKNRSILETQSLAWVHQILGSKIIQEDCINAIALTKAIDSKSKSIVENETSPNEIVEAVEETLEESQKLNQQKIEIERFQSTLLITGYGVEIDHIFETQKRVLSAIELSNMKNITELKKIFIDLSKDGLGTFNIEKHQKEKTIFVVTRNIDSDAVILKFCEIFQKIGSSISGYKIACKKPDKNGKGSGEQYVQSLLEMHLSCEYGLSGVHEEVKTGTGRIDILITPEYGEKYVIELKRVKTNEEKESLIGLEQLRDYMKIQKLKKGYLFHIDERRVDINHGPVVGFDKDAVHIKVFSIFSNPLPPCAKN